MKTMRSILVATALLTTSYVSAQVPVNQMAINPITSVHTVKQALVARGDTPAMLKGNIVKSLGYEKYQFRDATGTITVDIDDELWFGRPITPTTTVTIMGEVDVDRTPVHRVEIDVDAVHFE